jgi:hypothetical protein
VQHGLALGPAAAQERPQPGQQLREGERLDQVIFGPGVQAGDPVLDGVPGREDQHGLRVPGRPQVGENLEAVSPGQEQVQHQAVEGLGDRQLVALLAGGRRHDLVALGLQAAPEAAEDFALVFHDQYAGHGPPPGFIVRRGAIGGNREED